MEPPTTVTPPTSLEKLWNESKLWTFRDAFQPQPPRLIVNNGLSNLGEYRDERR